MYRPLGELLVWTSLLLLFSLAAANPLHHDAALVPASPLIAKRHPMYPYGAMHCGNFCTADRADAAVLLNVMADLDEDGGNDNCTTPARTCRRHACNNTSGIYVCNDNYFDLELSCALDVSLVVDQVIAKCCQRGFHKGTSGQQFVDELGYNVIIAYANCRHGIDHDRPGIGPPDHPWGPNGVCKER